MANPEWFIEYKKNLQCERCGENHTSCLQFHHKNPEDKLFDICLGIKSKTKEDILNEIGKCEVLCANCHFKHHYDNPVKRPYIKRTHSRIPPKDILEALIKQMTVERLSVHYKIQEKTLKRWCKELSIQIPPKERD